MSDRIRTDSYEVTRDEATELCVHHLRLAAMFFEASPDDNNISLKAEIERQCQNTPLYQAAHDWAARIWREYDKMKGFD